MKCFEIGDIALNYEDQEQRISATAQMLQVLGDGSNNQLITERVLQSLIQLAGYGLMWMVYWHLLLEDGSLYDGMSADEIEQNVEIAINEYLPAARRQQ